MMELRLQFFAKEGPGGEKTEKPTASLFKNVIAKECYLWQI